MTPRLPDIDLSSDFYQRYAILFDPVDTLPPHRECDIKFELIPGAHLKPGKLYSLTFEEQQELTRQLKELLAKGFIRPSTAPWSSPVLFAEKNNGELRLVVDYRDLNSLTVKNNFPLPLIGECLDQLRAAKFFMALDLKGAYNLLRVAEGHEKYTSFKTKYGLFEFCVMPFGLTNAPAIFQSFMNSIFNDLLDSSVIVYLDDILVFSPDLESHHKHVDEVL